MWFGPGLVLLLALIGYWMLIRKRAETVPAAPETLSEAEREELQAILTKVQRS
jgi:cytochrome c-type biogenesis protein CcmH/NrfF